MEIFLKMYSSLFLLLLSLLSLLVGNVHAKTTPYIPTHNVNFAIGNKVQTETDVTLSGPVKPLTLKRTYNSKSSSNTILGHGWTWSFGERLEINTNITRIISSGRHIPHINTGTDTWESQTGKKSTITAVRDGQNVIIGYQLTKLNGTVHSFDALGKLTQTQDKNNYTRSFAYSGDQIQSVTDSYGRSFSFTCNISSGYLETATTPIGIFTYSYLNDNLDRVTRPDTSYRQYLYNDPNDSHNLTGILDEENIQIITVEYDASDRVISSSLANDTETITIGYNGMERTITDELANTTTYQLTAEHGVGRIASFSGTACSVCPGTGDTSSYTYNSRLIPETFTNGRSYVTGYDNDDLGNLTDTTEAVGITGLERTTSVAYEPGSSRISTITRASVANPGQQTVITWAYDADGNPDSKTETGYAATTPISRVTDYTFDAMGRTTFIDGPRPGVSDTLSLDYYPDNTSQGNNQGMLHTITNGLGHIVEYQNYNGLRKPEKIIDANGVITLLTYNDRGRLLSKTTNSRTTNYQYDDAGVLLFVFPPDNRTLSYQYWPSGRIKTIADSDENYLKYSWDSTGNLEKREIYDPADTLTSAINYAADTAGRAYKTWNNIDSSLNLPSQEQGYDANGNQVTQKILKDAATQTILFASYDFDELDRLTGITNPGSATINTVLEYDAHDNQSRVIDDNSIETIFTYDDFGRRVTRTSADSGTTDYSYDESGNLLQQTDGNSTTLTHYYDDLNRLIRIDNDTATLITYGYDETVEGSLQNGFLTSMQDGSGSSVYLYNIHGELVKETRTTSNKTFITEYGYNDNGELEYLIYPSGRKITYLRTATGKLSSIESLYQNKTGILADNISEIPFGSIDFLKLGSSQQLTKTFDSLYRLDTETVPSLFERDYNYWSNNQVKDITDAISANDHSFSYDDLGQLDLADGPYGVIDYDLDNIGNRQTKTVNSTEVTSYGYQASTNRLNRVTDTGTTNYGYDNAGSLTSADTDNTLFTWTDDQRLATVSRNSSQVAFYQYDDWGQRTVKTVNSSQTTIFVYDQYGNLLSEADEQGSISKEYVYLEGRIFAFC